MKSIGLGPILDRIINFSSVVAGIILIFVTLSVTAEVVLRYFFGRPTVWVVEIAGYSLLYITFLVVSWIQKRQKHVRMDLIFNHLSPKLRSALNLFTSIICSIICFILTLYGAKVTLYFLIAGYPTPTPLRLPKFIIVTIIFFGSLLLLIEFIRTTYHGWLEMKERLK